VTADSGAGSTGWRKAEGWHVSDAIDHLTELDVDVSRVVTIGHSAGGHLATWAAGRSKLRGDLPGASPRVNVTGAISLGGVLDLDTAVATKVGVLLGGTAKEVPDRFAAADPIDQIPLSISVVAVHTCDDDVVPFALSTR
jgi:acetyl esterase/lipase